MHMTRKAISIQSTVQIKLNTNNNSTYNVFVFFNNINTNSNLVRFNDK